MTFSLPLRLLTLATGLLALLAGAGCTYEQGKQDTPKPCDADLSAVSYAKDIVPILARNCQNCHAQSVYLSQGGGHNWDNHAELQSYAKSGSLVAVLEQKDPRYAAVYMPRPIGSAKLAACDIERIKAWVAAGAPKN